MLSDLFRHAHKMLVGIARASGALGLVLLIALSVVAVAIQGSSPDTEGPFGYFTKGGEPLLNEKYSGLPQLPAPRSVFEAALAAADLRYMKLDREASGDAMLSCPAPLTHSKIRQPVEKCLMISGRDSPEGSERYVAFIDANDSVMFVENWYEYPSISPL